MGDVVLWGPQLGLWLVDGLRWALFGLLLVRFRGLAQVSLAC